MATTSKQDRAFISDVMGDEILQEIVSWIQENMSPEEVFDDEQLHAWAESNGLVEAE